jgi:hypothetical protein
VNLCEFTASVVTASPGLNLERSRVSANVDLQISWIGKHKETSWNG